MSFCTACGAKNPDEARFCNSCGAEMPKAAPQTPVARAHRIKPFDNPNELWKMFFFVALFDLGIYFFTSASTDLAEYGILFILGISAAYFGLAYWLMKVQGVDKGRSLLILPLIAFHVYAYLDGLSGLDDLAKPTNFDYYDVYVSGLLELLILIKLFLAIREHAPHKA